MAITPIWLLLGLFVLGSGPAGRRSRLHKVGTCTWDGQHFFQRCSSTSVSMSVTVGGFLASTAGVLRITQKLKPE